MDMSLDDFIKLKKISGAAFNKPKRTGNKFDRYKKQDMDEEEADMVIDTDVANDDDLEMPKLQPFFVRVPNKKPRKPVHERLGQRRNTETECESIHTSRLALYSKPQFRRNLIANRLNANFVSPAMVQRNKIALTALSSFVSQGMRYLNATDEQQGRIMVNTMSDTFESLGIADDLQSLNGSKYNMDLQEEISQLQGRNVQSICPDAVISYDGPGIDRFVKVRPDISNISLNQRFA